MGIASSVVSGIILKKTKPFLGESTPYILELSEYRFYAQTGGFVLGTRGARALSFAPTSENARSSQPLW